MLPPPSADLSDAKASKKKGEERIVTRREVSVVHSLHLSPFLPLPLPSEISAAVAMSRFLKEGLSLIFVRILILCLVRASRNKEVEEETAWSEPKRRP